MLDGSAWRPSWRRATSHCEPTYRQYYKMKSVWPQTGRREAGTGLGTGTGTGTGRARDTHYTHMWRANLAANNCKLD